MAKNKAKSVTRGSLSTALFITVSGVLLVFLYSPLINKSVNVGTAGTLSASQVSQALFAAVLTTATVVFLYYLAKILSFSKRWLFAASLYNFVIIFIKFFITSSNYKVSGEVEFSSVLIDSLMVGMLYLFAFWVLYLIFEGKIINRDMHKQLITTDSSKILLAAGLYAFVTLFRLVLFLLPPFADTTVSGYLNDVFGANSIVLNIVLFLVAFGAVEAFGQVRRKADLKLFFLTGAVLILLYHIAWAIFAFKLYDVGLV